VLTELGDGRRLEAKKEKAEVLLCLFKYECCKDKIVFFLMNCNKNAIFQNSSLSALKTVL